LAAIYKKMIHELKIGSLVRAACMRCHGTKCPLSMAFFVTKFCLDF
jgi:hypothetical protein